MQRNTLREVVLCATRVLTRESTHTLATYNSLYFETDVLFFAHKLTPSVSFNPDLALTFYLGSMRVEGDPFRQILSSYLRLITRPRRPPDSDGKSV